MKLKMRSREANSGGWGNALKGIVAGATIAVVTSQLSRFYQPVGTPAVTACKRGLDPQVSLLLPLGYV